MLIIFLCEVIAWAQSSLRHISQVNKHYSFEPCGFFCSLHFFSSSHWTALFSILLISYWVPATSIIYLWFPLNQTSPFRIRHVSLYILAVWLETSVVNLSGTKLNFLLTFHIKWENRRSNITAQQILMLICVHNCMQSKLVFHRLGDNSLLL